MPAAAVLEGQARHRLPTSPPASDDLARLAAAGTLPRRGAAPVPALLNNNPALSWDMAPDHRDHRRVVADRNSSPGTDPVVRGVLLK